jgi:hypothetical protein
LSAFCPVAENGFWPTTHGRGSLGSSRILRVLHWFSRFHGFSAPRVTGSTGNQLLATEHRAPDYPPASHGGSDLRLSRSASGLFTGLRGSGHLRFSSSLSDSISLIGQLTSLQYFSIAGFDEVVTVGHEFCGSGSFSVKLFDAVKVLRFKEMRKWEEWVTFGTENGGSAFPKFEELCIKYCDKLRGGLPILLPSLPKLEIYGCLQLMAPLSRTPAIRELKLSYCNEMSLKELPIEMHKLRIEGINALESLTEGMIDSNGGLQEFVIGECSSLVSLPKDSLPSTLKTLDINFCSSLVSIPKGMIDSNNCLQELVMKDCSSRTHMD